MDPRVQEMLDHHDIRRALAEYCHGCDRMDRIRMASVYLEDSWDDHGIYKCSGAELAERVTSSLKVNWEMCMHQLGQSIINVNGDEAGVETYFLAFLRRRTEAGPEIVSQGGRYVDRFRRTADGWKVEKRICMTEWMLSHGENEDFLKNANFVQPHRSGADPACQVLGFEHSEIPGLN
jgi:hypothetical protein